MPTTTNFSEADQFENNFLSTAVQERTSVETKTTTIVSQQTNMTITGDIRYTSTSSVKSKEVDKTKNAFISTTHTTAPETTTSVVQQKNWTSLGAADCYWTTSLEYSGTISYTFSGIPCQYWNTNYPHFSEFKPEDPTALDTNYCRESTNREGGPGCYTTDPAVQWEYCFIVKCDACGIDERLPVKPTGTTFHFKMGKFIGMVFTCDKLSPGTSVEHHPVSTCGSDDQWTTGYTTSCTADDCYTDSAAYRGKVTCTVGGIPCTFWTDFAAMSRFHQDKDTNYCRDPDNTGAPWCYTTDPEVRWDYCPVPICE